MLSVWSGIIIVSCCLLLLLLLLLFLLLLLLSNIMHTSHVCVTLTSHIYFLLTLAQGKKGCTRVTGYFSVGLSAVSVLRVCLLVKATYFSYGSGALTRSRALQRLQE